MSARLKASALFYAVTMSLLAATLVGAMIWMAHFRSQRAEHWLLRERLAANARSGAYAALLQQQYPLGEELFDLFGQAADSVVLERIPYGALDLVWSTARMRGAEARMWSLAGGAMPEDGVLWLARKWGPLHLCGDARITGTVHIAGGDVRRGHIEGRPFTGERLVDGRIVDHKDALPALRDGLEETLRILGSGRTALPESPWTPGSEAACCRVAVLDLHDSFDPIPRGLIGPLVLRCPDTLFIPADTGLRDVLVLAPYIIIAPDARLSGQFIAPLGIEVGRGAQLAFPSLLAVVRDELLSESPCIAVGDSAVIRGAIVAIDHSIRGRRDLVRIAPEAMVDGEVYATGDVELRGTVRGSVMAAGLSLRTPASSYQGYLLDGVIGPCTASERWGFGLVTNLHRNIIQCGPIVHSGTGV